MDTVLARTFSARPENKIAMRCPSWPNSPLHQYFGAKTSNRKNLDFTLSSLGYIQLYEYCCPSGKFNEQSVQGSSNENSFVHLEERHRSDGPYTLYRKPQRRMGLGLTERAREKRLLRYYKYFQGFQRKLQVSKQFQQTTQKRGSKARVNKIIKNYQPSPKSPPEFSGWSNSHVNEQVPTENLSATNVVQGGNLNEETSSKNKPMKSRKHKAHNDTDKKSINNDTKLLDSTFADPPLTSELTSKTQSIDSNNKISKRQERCKIISTILATIEETSSDGEPLQSEQNGSANSSECSLLVECSDFLANKQLSSRKSVSKPKSGSDPKRLRGILKYPKPRNSEHNIKNTEDEGEAYTLEYNQADIAFIEQQIQEQRSFNRKLGKVPIMRMAAEYLGCSQIGDSDLCSEWQPAISKEGTLRKVISRKEVRARPILHRLSSSSVAESLKSAEDKTGGDYTSELHASDNEEQENEENPDRETEDNRTATDIDASYDPNTASGIYKKKKPTHISRKKSQMSHGAIKFKGWDYGSTLGTHVLKKLPEEKDLSKQLAERGQRLKWGVVEEIEDYDRLAHYKSEPFVDPKVYVEEHGIMQIFEAETNGQCPVCDAVEGSIFMDVGKSQGKHGRYYLSYLSLNSYDAKYACERIDGHLAEMDAPTELKLVIDSLEGVVVTDEDIHLGGQVNVEGTISSRVGPSRLLHAAWESGRPVGDGQDCLTLRKRPGKTFKMNNSNCTASIYRFLCELVS